MTDRQLALMLAAGLLHAVAGTAVAQQKPVPVSTRTSDWITCLEALVGVVLFALVLSIALAVSRCSSGAATSSAVAPALAGLLVLGDAIQSDVHQSACAPGSQPGARSFPAGLSLHRVEFEGQTTLLVPVRWRAVRTPHGDLVLERTERRDGHTSSRLMRGTPLETATFTIQADRFGGRSLRVELVARPSTRDDHTAAVTHTVLAHLPDRISSTGLTAGPVPLLSVGGPLLDLAD